MDKVKILRLCNEIEDEVTDIAFNSTHKHIYDCCESIREYLKAITAEITAPPKSNGDRIRQMTDEDLRDFLDEITDCCFSNNDCDNCPMKYSDELYYRCNIEAWLKQEVSEDGKCDT